MAGKSVNCRYTQKNKDEILYTRLKTTKLLGEAISQCENPPKIWINSSTATIYRDEYESANNETDGTIGEGFSVNVAKAWEQTFNEVTLPEQVRKVCLRTAIVIGNEPGSIYEYFCNIAKAGAGGKMGSGEQKISWVHVDDWCRAVEFCIDTPKLDGPVNTSAPEVLTNEQFMAKFADHVKCSLRIKTPAFLIKLGTFLLRTEAELVLKSRWIESKKLADNGFKFDFANLNACLTDLKSRNPALNWNSPPKKNRIRYSLLTVVIISLLAYRILVYKNLEQSALLFVGLPVILSFLIVGTESSKSAVGAISKAITICFLLLLVFAIEGIVCILMAAPLFYGIGAIIGSIIDGIRRRSKKPKLRIMMLPILMFMSFEGTFPEFHFPREQIVEIEKILPIASHEILTELSKGPDVEKPKPWLLKIGFPEPQSIQGSSMNLGAIWSVHMAGGEGKPGNIVIQVTEKSDHRLTTTIVEDSSHINHWLTWHDVTYEWKAINEQETKLKMTIRFRRDLSPSWYFTPIEQFWVTKAGEHFINSVFDH